MLIRFLEDVKYTEDGFTCLQGHKDEIRDVKHSAACQMLRYGKACSAEKPSTLGEEVDKIMNDIRAITCKKMAAEAELYSRIDQLNSVLRVAGANVLQPVPNVAMNGFSAGREIRKLMEEGDESI